jgi:hypothetical protein
MKPALALLVFALCCSAADYPATVPPGSAIYVEPHTGLGPLLTTVFQAKHVPLRIVSSPGEADYTLNSHVVNTTDEVENHNWGTEYFPRTYESVILQTKNGDIVWKCIVPDKVLKQGRWSVAATVASHIHEVIVHSRRSASDGSIRVAPRAGT